MPTLDLAALNRSLAAACLATTCAVALAQQPAPSQPARGLAVPSVAAVPAMPLEGGVRTGKPFQLTATTRTRLRLADGNEIVTFARHVQARDSSGRMRIAVSGDTGGVASDVVLIQNASGETEFILSPQDRTAIRLSGQEPPAGSVPASSPGVAIQAVPAIPLPTMPLVGGLATALPYADFTGGVASWRTIELGDKVLNGVQASGRRLVQDIPAGRIGNKRPLHNEIEQWTAKDLGIPLWVRHRDAVAGTTEYRVEKLEAREPSPEAFTVPGDYRPVTEPAQTIHIQPAPGR